MSQFKKIDNPMNTQIDPELLQSFIAIADTGSFQRAAKQVHRTQSAVSMQIQRLEKIVGCSLFLRERPNVRLTAKGETLLGYARRILQLQDEAWGVLSEPEPTGSVRFGIPDDYALGILPQILERFASYYPQIEVEVRCATTPQLIELVDEDVVDLALISRIPGTSMGRYVKSEPLVWACSPLHATATRNPVPLALFQEDCFARQYAMTALSSVGRPYRIAFSSPNLAALLAVVKTGLAVAALPRSSVTANLQILTPDDGFPRLPDMELVVIQQSNLHSAAVDALAACIYLEETDAQM